MVDTSSISEFLKKLRIELDETTDIRRRADARITQLHTAIAALTALTSGEPLTFDGTLADACRRALKSSVKEMSPTEVRDAIKALGYDLSQHTNHMASIHSVLKRLVESGDVDDIITTEAMTKEGIKEGTFYRWTGRAETERGMQAFFGSGNSMRDAMNAVAQTIAGFNLKPGSMKALVEEAERAMGTDWAKQAQKAFADAKALADDVRAAKDAHDATIESAIKAYESSPLHLRASKDSERKK